MNQILEYNFSCKKDSFMAGLDLEYFDKALFAKVIRCIRTVEFSKRNAYMIRYIESRVLICLMATFDSDDLSSIKNIDELDISDIIDQLEGAISCFYS